MPLDSFPFKLMSISVHAIDDDALGFYRRCGFLSSPLGERVVVMPSFASGPVSATASAEHHRTHAICAGWGWIFAVRILGRFARGQLGLHTPNCVRITLIWLIVRFAL